MINVERAFDAFVKSTGGELVRELLPSSPAFPNADYLFRDHQSGPVIAELKCLTKDLLQAGYQQKIEQLVEIWIKKTLIRPFAGQRQFSSRDLPQQCQEELFQLLGRRVKKDVIDANKQIRETKKYFGLNDATGLLLLVNDGNYSLEHEIVIFLVQRALQKECSSINSIVYFTVNMTSRVPDIDGNFLVWAPAHRLNMQAVPQEFLTCIRDGWVRFHAKLIGERVRVFTAGTGNAIEQIKFLRPPEPREYYQKNHKAWVNLRREISEQIDIMLLASRNYDHGDWQDAGRIALAARVLMHGGSNKPSLVHDYFGNNNIGLRSTTMINSLPVPNAFGFLGIQGNTGHFRPLYDSAKRNETIPLEDWWENEPVLKLYNEQNKILTRKEIILAATAESFRQDVSHENEVKYQRLVAGMGFQFLGRTKEGNVKVTPSNAHLATIRQIGHELLRSEELMALAR